MSEEDDAAIEQYGSPRARINAELVRLRRIIRDLENEDDRIQRSTREVQSSPPVTGPRIEPSRAFSIVPRVSSVAGVLSEVVCTQDNRNAFSISLRANVGCREETATANKEVSAQQGRLKHGGKCVCDWCISHPDTVLSPRDRESHEGFVRYHRLREAIKDCIAHETDGQRIALMNQFDRAIA